MDPVRLGRWKACSRFAHEPALSARSLPGDERRADAGNADGSGDWVKIAGGATSTSWCEWVDGTAVCYVGHEDPLAIYSSDVVAVTDDGQRRVTLAHNTISHAVNGNSLYFVRSSGGLYVVDGLPRPAH